MRATTAQRMLIGLGIFLVAGTGLLFLTGNREAGQVAREMFVLVVIVGGTFWLGFRFRVLPRRDSFRGQTEALAFTPQVGDPLGLLDLPFTMFHWAGSVRQIENTATGSHGGQEIVIADYWFAPTAAEQVDDYERYTCVIAPVDGRLVRPDRRPRTARVASPRRDRRSSDQHGAGGVQPRVPDPRRRRAVRERVRRCSDDAVAAASEAPVSASRCRAPV